MLRPGGAVEPDDVDVQRLEHGEHRRRIGAEQHAAGDVERDGGHDRDRSARRGSGLAGAENGCLGLENVLLRLDDEDVDATLDERGGLLAVHGHKVCEPQPAHRRIARGGQEAGGAHAPGNEARTPVGGILVGDPPGEARGRDVQVGGDVALTPLLESRARRLERAGLDDVAPRLEKSAVHPLDDLRRMDGKTVHPALQPGSAVVVDAGVLGMEAGAHGAVKDEHTLAQRVEEWRSNRGGHRDHVIRERLRDTLANRPTRLEETLFGTTPTPSRQYPQARPRPSTGRR